MAWDYMAQRRHKRVYLAKGKASARKCVDCSGPASEWSQIHGTDGESVDDYEARCRRCHRKYDDTPIWRAAISEAMIGNTNRTHGGKD